MRAAQEIRRGAERASAQIQCSCQANARGTDRHGRAGCKDGGRGHCVTKNYTGRCPPEADVAFGFGHG